MYRIGWSASQKDRRRAASSRPVGWLPSRVSVGTRSIQRPTALKSIGAVAVGSGSSTM